MNSQLLAEAYEDLWPNCSHNHEAYYTFQYQSCFNSTVVVTLSGVCKAGLLMNTTANLASCVEASRLYPDDDEEETTTQSPRPYCHTCGPHQVFCSTSADRQHAQDICRNPEGVDYFVLCTLQSNFTTLQTGCGPDRSWPDDFYSPAEQDALWHTEQRYCRHARSVSRLNTHSCPVDRPVCRASCEGTVVCLQDDPSPASCEDLGLKSAGVSLTARVAVGVWFWWVAMGWM